MPVVRQLDRVFADGLGDAGFRQEVEGALVKHPKLGRLERRERPRHLPIPVRRRDAEGQFRPHPFAVHPVLQARSRLVEPDLHRVARLPVRPTDDVAGAGAQPVPLGDRYVGPPEDRHGRGVRLCVHCLM